MILFNHFISMFLLLKILNLKNLSLNLVKFFIIF